MRLRQASPVKPPLRDIINLYDFEQVASQTLSKKSWAYISSGSCDNITRDANLAILRKIWLRPAVMRNVQNVNTKTTLFGCQLDLPIFIAPTGAVRTAGPDGELAMARAASSSGIIQCIATPASYPHQEILGATSKHAFFQIYVNKARTETERVLRQGIATGKIKAIFVTADLPVVSKREADERIKSDAVPGDESPAGSGRDQKGAGLARQGGDFIDPSLNWDDISWIRSLTDLPIVVKGIQRWEDAKLAMQHGCQGIILSNHGGRAADNALPAILILLELHRHCPEVFGALELLVDGGFRRGSDIVKAICLGASAVGLGRPFMYAVNYGQQGVEHAVNILRDEIQTTMRLCGIKNLMQDSNPTCLNTAEVDHLVYQPNQSYEKRWDKRQSRL
ncbi:alpha-hydroxy acid dehydrogenase FMn-dependent [Fusarium beomiforme]|uniref:L-lactate dehydrogenase (cytochrome) n=1 Tax=Fusarium beomiforme TaxID=44412 RepID=A0A9P5A3N2_9HYPO|nr:alpha-hydroxy acid dehydrogenase FMn-dependent [Fusarium beomiforme]